jgi:membrane protease YdiL (CAAX protease family)
MSDSASRSPRTPAASAERPAVRPLVLFAVISVASGCVLLTVPVVLDLPQEPFVLAVTFLAMLLVALLLTAREGGRPAVGRLLRDAIRLPVHWWWIPVAMLGIPVTVWGVGAAVGVAQPLTTTVLLGFAIQLLSSAVIVNIWEELAMTGYFQRRAIARWGVLGGSAITALVFAGIHLPLAFAGGSPGVGIAVLVIAAISLRLLIAGVDRWSGRSILTVGLLHGSFNAAAGLLEPGADWIRLGVTLLLGIAVAVALQTRRTAFTAPTGVPG